jgi:hypothetical protein
MRRRLIGRLIGRVAGFSVTETTAVMTGLSLLTATAAPNIQEYIDLARETKAIGDVRVVVVSLVRLMNDVGQFGRGTGRPPADLLVGPGQAPDAAGRDASEWTAAPEASRVEPLADHLLTNAAGYPADRWRGPYLEHLSEDPWGCRYAINTGLLGKGTGNVTLVLSAGPNCVVETPFRMTGLSIPGDDVVGLVSAGH